MKCLLARMMVAYAACFNSLPGLAELLIPTAILQEIPGLVKPQNQLFWRTQTDFPGSQPEGAPEREIPIAKTPKTV